MTDAELAYAAGFFDGEGHIGIVHQTTAVARGKRYVTERYFLNVSMSQNDPAPLQWLRERFGGSTRFVRGKRSYDNGHYERWNWVVTTHQALIFLKQVRPFLIVKAEQADLAFTFAATGAGRGVKTLPHVQAVRRKLYQQMKDAKHAYKIPATAPVHGDGSTRSSSGETCGSAPISGT